MADDEQLLAVVVGKDYNEVFVHLDLAGTEYLIRELTRVRDSLLKGECEHEHLFSADWGGWELSLSSRVDTRDDGHPVNHVKIYGWTDEWVEKHGFKRS